MSFKIGVTKMYKFHRKTPVLESLFNKVAGRQAWNFIKKRLQHWRFPVKFAKFLRIPPVAAYDNLFKRVTINIVPENFEKNPACEWRA